MKTDKNTHPLAKLQFTNDQPASRFVTERFFAHRNTYPSVAYNQLREGAKGRTPCCSTRIGCDVPPVRSEQHAQ